MTMISIPCRYLLVLFCVAGITGLLAAPAGAQGLDPHLAPLAPYVGKTWSGTLQEASDRPMVDVARWERALNGKAIRILHSMNDGVYGGETIIRWNADADRIEFYYFTTEGFMTTGTMRVEDGRFISHEHVQGNEDGITEVRATGEVLPDGRLRSTSEYLRDGEWQPGHVIVYEEAPGAEVRFR